MKATSETARRAWTTAALLLWLALAIVGAAKGYTGKTIDFAVYHTAGVRFAEGSALYREADGGMPFKYPPIAAPVLVAFGALPLRIAAALWNLCSMAALLWVARFGLPKLRSRDPAEGVNDAAPFAWSAAGALWATAILLHPLFFELARGQADLLMLGALTAAVFHADRRPGLAGAFAVAAVSLKLPALLVVLYFLRFRNWRALLSMGAVVAVMEAVVLARYGLGGTIELHQSLRHLLAESTPASVMGAQGWVPLVLRVTKMDPTWGLLAVQAGGAAALIAILHWRRAGATTWFATLAVAVAGLSPLCWNPNYVAAFPALVLAFNLSQRAAKPAWRWTAIAIGLAASALFVAISPGIMPPDTYNSLQDVLRPYAWLSLGLVAYLIVKTRPAHERKPLTASDPAVDYAG